MKLQALADRVILQAIEKDSVTESGIYLPESANKEKPFIYTVVGVGPGTDSKPVTVSVGDTVLCGQYSGDEVKFEGSEYKIVANEYILAKIA